MNYLWSFFGNKEDGKSKKKEDESNIPDLNNYAFDFNVDKKQDENNIKQKNTNKNINTVNISSNNDKNDEDEPIEEIKKDTIEISLRNKDDNIIKENIEQKEQILNEDRQDKKEKENEKEEEANTEIALENKDNKDNKDNKEKEIIKSGTENQPKKTKKKKIKKVKKDKAEIKEDKNLNNKVEEEKKIIVLEEKKNDEIIIDNPTIEISNDNKQQDNKENNDNNNELISNQEERKKSDDKIEIIISRHEDNIIEINEPNLDEKARKIAFEGPENSPYENGHFEISINYDSATDVKPVIKFLTKIYHYNISQKSGEVLCPFIWNQKNNEEENIKNIKALLLRPDTRFPCSRFIKDEYYNNYPTYKEKAQKFTENYAMN